MTKTLAAIAVIIVAGLMTYGIREVAKRNEAVSTRVEEQESVRVEEADMAVQTSLKLEIESPREGEVVLEPKIRVVGRTVGGAEVQVDDKEILADKNGEFSVQVTLDEGENEIMIVVNNEIGEYAEKSVRVSYEPGE